MACLDVPSALRIGPRHWRSKQIEFDYRLSWCSSRAGVGRPPLSQCPRNVALQRPERATSPSCQAGASNRGGKRSGSSGAARGHSSAAREERDLLAVLNRNASVAIQLEFEGPPLASRQRRDRLALHRLDKGRLRAVAKCRRAPFGGFHAFRFTESGILRRDHRERRNFHGSSNLHLYIPRSPRGCARASVDNLTLKAVAGFLAGV
jgi:hypothetical protein